MVYFLAEILNILEMKKSEMQHQFWITKKTVQRRFGSKEDENIVSSDAELDSKIEVFKAISDTSTELGSIIDQYQERLCVLSQEECVFGRFLKEIGKRSKSTGQSISNTGRAVSYSGQQRMCIRVPLLRLQHEVEVFRSRAVSDTRLTINSMEKDRTEYRAALSWMKSSSSELDPDTGKGLDKFRMAQSHVRNAKQIFDNISLDSIQKIDLLAAARCNMYSHALASYMTELLQFAKKTANTFEAISKALLINPKYDFCLLKDLSQNDDSSCIAAHIETIDRDKTLFFSGEYTDKESEEGKSPHSTSLELIDYSTQSDIDELSLLKSTPEDSTRNWSKISLNTENLQDIPLSQKNSTYSTSLLKIDTNRSKLSSSKSKKMHTWMDVFAELDPLVNSEEFDSKLNGCNINFEQT